MNKLLKYILIVFVICFISTAILLSFGFYINNYYTPQAIEAIHSSGNLVPAPPASPILQTITRTLLPLACIITFILSVFYIIKSPNTKDYFLSLLMPLSLFIFSFLEIMILSWTTSIFSGESGMGAMFIMLASIGTLIANAITNLIIFLIKKS